MKNITEFISELEANAAEYFTEGNLLMKAAEVLKEQSGNLHNIAISEKDSASPGNTQTELKEKDLFKDYPYKDKLSDKLRFFDSILNRPFRSSARLDLIEKLEGKERREEYEKRISQQINAMINNNLTYIGKKYGSNKNTFYFKTQWAIWNEKECCYNIKPEYEITPAEFDAANIPEHKRKEFTWVVPRAVKALAQENSSVQ